MARIIKCDLCTATGDEVNFTLSLESYAENKHLRVDVCKVDAEKIMDWLKTEFGIEVKSFQNPGGEQALRPMSPAANAKPARVVSQ